MTKEDFEKLVELDPNKDAILERAMTGLGVLNNDEEWYDICARQYGLCNGNLGSFGQNLSKTIDFYKYTSENFKIVEINDKKMIALFEDTMKKIDSYIAEHPINKKVCGKEVDEKEFRDKIIPEIKKTIFNYFTEPKKLIENYRAYLEEIIKLWKIVKITNKYELVKISFKFDKDGGSHNITNKKIKDYLWEGICSRTAWLTPHEYLISGKKLNEKKIKEDLEKVKLYSNYNFSQLYCRLTYKLFQILANYNLVEETDSNEYDVKTSNNKCAVLTTEIAVWIFDLLASLNIHHKVEDIDLHRKDEKKDKIKDSLKNKQARDVELLMGIYRRRYTERFTEYIY